MRRARIAIYTAALIVGAASTPAATAHVAVQSHDLDAAFTSVALRGTAHAHVVLPPGYTTSGERYPVVYFLHGLPAGSSSYLGNQWLSRAFERLGRPAILVESQGARDDDSDPEYLNWGTGRQWETFVAEELPHYIDTRFRTIRDRSGRAIVGLSAGGYGATILGLHHLGTFAAIESWSGYFHPTDPTGTKPLPRGALTNVHTLVGRLRGDERSRPTFFAFYVGKDDLRFSAENVQLHRELLAAHVPHVFDEYPGAHTTALWQGHAEAWLKMALDRLDAPRA